MKKAHISSCLALLSTALFAAATMAQAFCYVATGNVIDAGDDKICSMTWKCGIYARDACGRLVETTDGIDHPQDGPREEVDSRWTEAECERRSLHLCEEMCTYDGDPVEEELLLSMRQAAGSTPTETCEDNQQQ